MIRFSLRGAMRNAAFAASLISISAATGVAAANDAGRATVVHARVLGQIAPVPPGETDKTLAALHDELQRSKDRLVLPGQARPYFIAYRLLDLDMRTIVAEFGALISTTSSRSRQMSVDVRVGDYKIDSSNFISDEGFSGFLGTTGSVGIDRDYNSLRQDLWLATDQGYKRALDSLSHKQGFLRSLANAPTIDDLSQEPPIVAVEPRVEPDWTNRNWEEEARTVSAVLRNYPELYNARVTYRLIYATTYLVTTEGTEIRTTRSLAAIEAAAGSEASDGATVHDFLAIYKNTPGELPAADAVRQRLDGIGRDVVALRSAPTVQDYDGPVLFEAPAAASLLAQVLGPSLSGARPVLSMNSRFDQMMDALGGRSDWSERAGQRVLPANVSLTDDPTAREFQGQPLIGAYDIDQEGVRAEKVAIVENGMLRQLLMSRRPGPEFDHSNGHGRSTFLADPRAMMSNLFFTAANGDSPADLKKKFLDDCKQNGQRFCLVVRSMDNPMLSSTDDEERSDYLGLLASGAPNGDRLPLLVYRVNVDDGQEQLVRGAVLSGMTARLLRNILAIGNDNTVFSFTQSEEGEIAGTALGAFGTADDGVPSTVVAPSLLFDEVEVRGPHGEPRRTPLVPPPPLQ